MRAFDEGNLRSGESKAAESENVVRDHTDWQRLGFNKPAFEDNCNGNYFPVASWSDAFTELNIFRQGNDPLLVLPAITGSGKSTFLAQFISSQNNPLSTHYLKARSIFSLRHLLNTISEHYSDFRNVSSNTDQFLTELRSVTREQGPQLLVIDDAQRLSRETLMSLLQVLAGQDLSNLWLRVILCGEPQLEDRVQSLFDELELAFSFPAVTLDSMTANETRAYLKHHLDVAGYQGSFPFSKSMVKHIHTLSSGYPGRINRVAQQVLIDSANKNSAAKSATKLVEFWGSRKIKLLSVAIISGAISAFWYTQTHQGQIAMIQSPLPLMTADNTNQNQSSDGDRQVAAIQPQQETSLYIPLPHGPSPQKDLSESQQRALNTGNAGVSGETTHTQGSQSSQSLQGVQTSQSAHALQSFPVVASLNDPPPSTYVNRVAKSATTQSSLQTVNLNDLPKSARDVLTSMVATSQVAEARSSSSANNPQAVHLTMADRPAGSVVNSVKSVAHTSTSATKSSLTHERNSHKSVSPLAREMAVTKNILADASDVTKNTSTTGVSMPEQSASVHQAITSNESASSTLKVPKEATTTATPTATVASTQAPKVGLSVPVASTSKVNDQTTSKQNAAAKSVGGFTLQLMGVHDKAKLDEYISRHKLKDNVGYYQTTLNGQPWFVLVFGEYNSFEDANLALAKLPADLNGLHPWVKSFDAIPSQIQWLDESTGS